MKNCKGCGNEYDPKEIIRQFGTESSIGKTGMCSALCLTRMISGKKKYEGMKFQHVEGLPAPTNKLWDIERVGLYAYICPLDIRRIAVVQNEDNGLMQGAYLEVKKRTQDEHPVLCFDGSFSFDLKGAKENTFNDWKRATVADALKIICPIKDELA